MNALTGAMRRLSIRSRLIGTLVVMLVLVCAVGATGLLLMRQQGKDADAFITQSLRKSHALAEANRLVGDINRAEKDMVICYDDRIALNQHRDKWTASVVQLDQMTQQNAALVEESAAAAESLKDQAAKLAQVVGTFRLTSV